MPARRICPGATTTQRGSSWRASRWRRPSRSARSSRSAIRSPTARARRRTRTTAGRINWRSGWRRRRSALGVLNEGIAGNRVLCDGAGVSALARFDRDVLAQTGVDARRRAREHQRHRHRARQRRRRRADDLIAGHQQLIERAHAHGLKIYGATLTPFDGAAYYTPEGEAKRQAVNDWIRTSKAYDGVIDFDAAVRDPAAPTKIQQQFNPGDNLHLNDAGYQAMADGHRSRACSDVRPGDTVA